jgi:drug/metabolite transporter (DMT)-like permease
MSSSSVAGGAGTIGAVSAVSVTVVLWASAFPAIRAALTSFSPTDLAFLRFAIASVAVAVFWVVKRPTVPTRKDLTRVILAGVLGIAAYNLLLNFGEVTVTAGAASFLINLNPIFALILAIAFGGERVRLWGVLGVLISFAGVAIISLGDLGNLELNTGSVLVVGAAFCFAASFVVQRPLLGHLQPIAVTSSMIWAATAVMLPFAPSAFGAIQHASWEAIVAVVFLGLGPSMLAYLAWSYALVRYPVSRATSFLYVVPPLTLLVSFLWLGEIPTLLTLVGGAVMLTGVVLVNTLGRSSAHTR